MKNINKFIIVPVVAISVFAVTDFPESHAKYIKETDLNQPTLTSQEITINHIKDPDSKITAELIKDKSNYLEANFDVSFPKNNIAYTNDTDTYNITLNNKCVFTENNQSTITKNASDAIDDKFKFNVNCDVTSEKISLKIDVTETITNNNGVKDKVEKDGIETDKMPYLSYDKEFTSTEYFSDNNIENPTDENKTGLYDTAINKLNEKYGSNTNLTTLTNYFNSVFAGINPITDEKFKQNITNLNGFNFIDDSEAKRTYTFEDSFIGYALTWDQLIEPPYYTFVFSTTNNIENLFRKYIELYGTDRLKNNEDYIIDYINTLGGLDLLLNGSIDMPEISVEENGDIKTVNFNDGLITSIKNKKSNPEIAKAIDNTIDKNENLYVVFTSSMLNSPAADAMQNDLDILDKIMYSYDDLNNLEGFAESLTKNNDKDMTHFTAFSDTYIIEGSISNIIINIYTTAKGTEDFNQYTYFQLYEIAHNKTITLASPTGEKEDGKTPIQTFIKNINDINTKINPTLSQLTEADFVNPATNGDYTTYTINGVEYNLHTDSTNGVTYLTYTIQ